MADWPSTLPAPLRDTEGSKYKPQIRSEKDAPYVQSRPAFTGSGKRRWSVRLLLSLAQFNVFDAFFSANAGLVVTNFPEPGDSATMRSILFSEDTYSWTFADNGKRKVTVAVQEA